VRLKVRWQVTVGEVRPLIEALHALMVLARVERGYIHCALTTDLNGHVTLSYTEDWATEEDLERQVASDRFTKLAELIESSSTHPRVRFHLPGGRRGLDYAEDVRARRPVA
jgi:quinol monooxygenase YgiN